MAYAPPLYVAQRILATSEDVLRKRLPSEAGRFFTDCSPIRARDTRPGSPASDRCHRITTPGGILVWRNTTDPDSSAAGS